MTSQRNRRDWTFLQNTRFFFNLRYYLLVIISCISWILIEISETLKCLVVDWKSSANEWRHPRQPIVLCIVQKSWKCVLKITFPSCLPSRFYYLIISALFPLIELKSCNSTNWKEGNFVFCYGSAVGCCRRDVKWHSRVPRAGDHIRAEHALFRENQLAVV